MDKRPKLSQAIHVFNDANKSVPEVVTFIGGKTGQEHTFKLQITI